MARALTVILADTTLLFRADLLPDLSGIRDSRLAFRNREVSAKTPIVSLTFCPVCPVEKKKVDLNRLR